MNGRWINDEQYLADYDLMMELNNIKLIATQLGEDKLQLEAQIIKLEARIKELEASPSQEPVAWMVYTLDGSYVYITDNPKDFTKDQRALPLYTLPPDAAQIAELTKERDKYKELHQAVTNANIELCTEKAALNDWVQGQAIDIRDYKDEIDKLQEQIAKLEAEITEANERTDRIRNSLNDDIRAIERRLRAELAAAEKDAERYRWLRDSASSQVLDKFSLLSDDDAFEATTLDAFIDAAMKLSPGDKGESK